MVSPAHTVLLVHEMLNAFVAEGGAFDRTGRRIDVTAMVKPMARLLAAARGSGTRVAYVTWTSHGDQSTQNLVAGRSEIAPELKEVSTIEGTWGSEVFEPVAPRAGDWVIKKYRPDAFFGTPLDAFLRWNAIRTIVIVGVGAEVGIVPTLMTASNLGYLRVAVADCIRPTNPARINDAMRYVTDYAVVKTHHDLVTVWGGQAQ